MLLILCCAQAHGESAAFGVDGADWRAELVGSKEVQAEVGGFLDAVLGAGGRSEPRRSQWRGASGSSHDEM
jgi:hypothetical protein